MSHATHLGGIVYLDDLPLTLRDADWLRDDVAAECMTARALYRAHGMQLPNRDAVWGEMERLSALENELRGAIEECKKHRKAAAWRDPYAADPPEPTTGRIWDKRRVRA